MLGLSQGYVDRNMKLSKLLANDTLMGRLEQIYCSVASQIVECNECYLNNFFDQSLTQKLDLELQRAARSLPSKWWLTPNMDVATTDLFWNTRRMFAQVFHYNLLNQLHLPFMLCSFLVDREDEYSLQHA